MTPIEEKIRKEFNAYPGYRMPDWQLKGGSDEFVAKVLALVESERKTGYEEGLQHAILRQMAAAHKESYEAGARAVAEKVKKAICYAPYGKFGYTQGYLLNDEQELIVGDRIDQTLAAVLQDGK